MGTLEILKTEIVFEESKSCTKAALGLKRLVKYTTIDNSIYYLVECINYNHGSSDTYVMPESKYNNLYS